MKGNDGKGISLRWKMTAWMTLLILAIASVLTIVSIWNANQIFIPTDGIPSVTTTVGDEITTETEEDTSVAMRQVTVAEEPPQGEAGEALTTMKEVPRENTVDAIQITIQRENFRTSSLVVMAMIICVGVIVVWFVMGRVLQSLQVLAETMADTTEKNLSNRIPIETMSDAETKQLAKAFNQCMEKLETAFAAQKQFLAAAAHELKTPLACIQTDIEVLQLEETPSIEDCKETMEVIGRNTSRLIAMTDQLLAMEKTKTAIETVFLKKLVEEIQISLASTIQQKNIIFSADIQGMVLGEETTLYRMLWNLIENAVKYTPEGGEIVVKTEKKAEGILLSVADTGIGIPKEALPHIFEPFYRVDASRSRKVGGSGLGLALAKEIILQYNGDIRVESTVGQGTTFFVFLPKEHACDKVS